MVPTLRDGDLVFIRFSKGDLPEAIEDVTCRQFGVEGPRLSHMGILRIEPNAVSVVEAAEDGVRMSSWETFLEQARRTDPLPLYYLRRPKLPDAEFLGRLREESERVVNSPFDREYGMHSDRFHCASFVAEVFRRANGGAPYFESFPMYFGEPDDRARSIWDHHFRRIGAALPENKPGLSPLSIYLSKRLLEIT